MNLFAESLTPGYVIDVGQEVVLPATVEYVEVDQGSGWGGGLVTVTTEEYLYPFMMDMGDEVKVLDVKE